VYSAAEAGRCAQGLYIGRKQRRDRTEPREQFTGYLAAKLREIRLVEYTFSNNPVTRDGHGPRASNPVGERLPDITERERGEATPVLARLGPAGLETVDTLIMAGIAATRAEAIRWALDHPRQPAYQRLRGNWMRRRAAQERVPETGARSPSTKLEPPSLQLSDWTAFSFRIWATSFGLDQEQRDWAASMRQDLPRFHVSHFLKSGTVVT
jgi:hypothetical protein